MDPRARPALLTLLMVLGCGTETFSNQAPRPDDAAADAAADSGDGGVPPLTDAGGDAPIAPGGTFFCQGLGDGGAVHCTLGAEVCCVRDSEPNFCVKSNESCASAGGTARPYACLTQGHCAATAVWGPVCCAMQDGSGAYVTSVACVPAEQCVSPHVRACANQTDCTASTTCTPYDPQLSVCR